MRIETDMLNWLMLKAMPQEKRARNASSNEESAPVRVDIERMEKALASPSIAMPSGLTREQKRQFILSHAG